MEAFLALDINRSTGTLLFISLIGLLWGDFMGMVVQRVAGNMLELTNGIIPEVTGSRLFGGRSRCMHCQAKLRIVDNIPLVSWFLLRGSSHCCGQPISKMYPLTELFFMGAFPLAFYCLPPFPAVLFLIALSVCYTASIIDLRYFHLPIEGNYLLLLLAVFVASFYQPTMSDKMFYAILLWTSLHLLNTVTRHNILGEGDIPIIVGIWILSFGYYFNIGLVIASVISIAIFLSNLFLKRDYSEARIVPFGPGVCVAYLFTICIGLTQPVFY